MYILKPFKRVSVDFFTVIGLGVLLNIRVMLSVMRLFVSSVFVL